MLLEKLGRIVPHAEAPAKHVAALVAKADTLKLTHLPDDCLTFVVDEEDGGRTYYAKHYEHFDWPEGASGPTIGVGYDCGYVSLQEAEDDWGTIVSPETMELIRRAVGLRGETAHAFVRAHGNSVTIPFNEALTEFERREEPKWLARCRQALPNFDDLPAECQGALFSLSYNRGTGGYQDPSPRDAEMRAIHRMMAAHEFTGIADEIESMKRLWPKGGDLWNRRIHEAALFRKGMGSPSGAADLLAPIVEDIAFAQPAAVLSGEAAAAAITAPEESEPVAVLEDGSVVRGAAAAEILALRAKLSGTPS